MMKLAAAAASPELQYAYSIRRFGEIFNIGRTSIYAEIRAGRLSIRKAGKRTLIAHEDAMAWFDALPKRG